jgi:hypothetical protein
VPILLDFSGKVLSTAAGHDGHALTGV